ncbi:hypothetical protein [Breznakiella homolactica]|uniref:Uncharacterized protein n=1 Tax=Breznakiella homolactica TaxID=2798577 RepID=A0A7T7XQ66_9SPIR|nr:hypothetical protein [Breznakiella homolactica]QQO10363.1 hypothetical protein JFL75_05445 [Breznakiella homolactica]
MQDNEFNELVVKMEKIAEIVNKFSNSELQSDVYNRLISCLNIITVEDKKKTPVPPTPQAVKKQKAPRKKGAKYTPKIIKTLNLSPQGKVSFSDFIIKKKPQSNEDKYPVVVYYLENILKESPVTIDHVFTVFRLVKEWKEPRNLIAGITVAGSRKGTLDTADYNDLKTTPAGRNFVEHELPKSND